jgi:CPA1 family monovalent cation:H+ antiporter
VAGLELVLLCLAVSAGLRIAAERLNVPYAAVLVLGGLVLALLPGLPDVNLPPDVLFLIFIPPLLYAGAIQFPLRELQKQAGPILRLSVLMVLVSTVLVAVIAHSFFPSFTWAAAFTLGAIISPPDPVAVLSVMRSLRLPRAIESILEGEGLINDATALILYRFAVAAVVTGAFSMSAALLRFVLAGGGGVAIGLVVGFLLRRLHRLGRDIAVVSNTLSLLTPFAAYLAADIVGASGVLSVLACGLYLARVLWPDTPAATRVQITGSWTVVTFLLESLVFILVGLELPVVMRAAERLPLTTLLGESLIVTVCIVLARILWVMPSTYIFRILGRWFGLGNDPLPSWRMIFFIAWAGLRGADSLVLALALPLTTMSGARFPAREQIIFITFGVIFVTLVFQGPTLAPLARRLRVGVDEDEEAEEAHARLVAAETGLRVLEAFKQEGKHPEVVRYLGQRHRQRARRWAAKEAEQEAHSVDTGDSPHQHLTVAGSHEAALIDERRGDEYRRVRGAMLKAEQQAVLDLRDKGVIGDDVMRRILRDLDLETILLETSEPVIDPVREVPSAIPDGG